MSISIQPYWMGPPLISNLVLWTCLKKGGGALAECTGKFLKFESRKWHLQHSENTFCKKLGFQNTVLMVRFVIDHMLSIENQHFRENIYMIIYIYEWNYKVVCLI